MAIFNDTNTVELGKKELKLFLNANLFLIKPFLIAKFDCMYKMS